MHAPFKRQVERKMAPGEGLFSAATKVRIIPARHIEQLRRHACSALLAQQAWIEHEHTEWAIDAGDNPADTYQACHGFATAKCVKAREPRCHDAGLPQLEGDASAMYVRKLGTASRYCRVLSRAAAVQGGGEDIASMPPALAFFPAAGRRNYIRYPISPDRRCRCPLDDFADVRQGAPWFADLRSELLSFPAGTHDDRGDALGLVGQLLDRISAGQKPKPPEIEYRDAYRPPSDLVPDVSSSNLK